MSSLKFLLVTVPENDPITPNGAVSPTGRNRHNECSVWMWDRRGLLSLHNPSGSITVPSHLLALKHSRARVVHSNFLVINFELNCGYEDSGRVFVLVLISGEPRQDDGVVGDADSLEVLDRSGQTDGPLLVAEDDLPDVGETLLVVRPRALLVDRLAERLALGWHPSPGTTGKMVSAPGRAPHHLAELRGAQLGQSLHLADARVIVTEWQTWVGGTD